MSDRRAWLSRRGVLAGAVGVVGSLSGCATLFPDEARPPDERDWPMAGYDPAGTYHKPEVSGPTSGLEEVWSAEVDPAFARPEPTLYDGRLFVTAADGTAAFDAADGNRIGTVGPRHTGAVAVVTESVYRDATLLVPALDDPGRRLAGLGPPGLVGGRRWTYRGGEIIAAGDRGPLPVVVDGTAYVPTTSWTDGERETAVVAVDGSDGRRRWRRTVSEPGEFRFRAANRPSVDGDAVYVAGWFGGVQALDRSDGSRRWRRPNPFDTDGVRECRVVATPEEPVVVVGDEEIVALAPTDGERRWSRTTPEDVRYRPGGTPVAQGTVLVTREEREADRLRALDVETGDTRWTATVGSADETVTPVVADGTVYVADRSRLVALDLDDGTPLFERSFEYPLGTPIVGDGRLYVAGFDTVYALEGSA